MNCEPSQLWSIQQSTIKQIMCETEVYQSVPMILHYRTYPWSSGIPAIKDTNGEERQPEVPLMLKLWKTSHTHSYIYTNSEVPNNKSSTCMLIYMMAESNNVCCSLFCGLPILDACPGSQRYGLSSCPWSFSSTMLPSTPYGAPCDEGQLFPSLMLFPLMKGFVSLARSVFLSIASLGKLPHNQVYEGNFLRFCLAGYIMPLVVLLQCFSKLATLRSTIIGEFWEMEVQCLNVAKFEK